MSAERAVEQVFRHEFGRLVSALVRWLGPAHVALAEDAMQDALVSAVQHWRVAVTDAPRAWLMQVAKHRAIDLLRRSQALAEVTAEAPRDDAFAPEADVDNQVAMMFACCDDSLSRETHVTLVLRLLCGLSPREIAAAFLVDPQTVDRRLHRGRGRLAERGHLVLPQTRAEWRAAQPSVEHALYLLFSEGYHGTNEDHPLRPALCADALRLAELLLQSRTTERPTVHALAALFCFDSARLATRCDDEGVFVPLAEQDRSRWNRALLERGLVHLGRSAEGPLMSRWHLEAGIAFEHARAASVSDTDWARIVALYDELSRAAPSPIVELNRALAVAESQGLNEGRHLLASLETNDRLSGYSLYWAARADLERRSGQRANARLWYERATRLAQSRAERASHERRLRQLPGGDPEH